MLVLDDCYTTCLPQLSTFRVPFSFIEFLLKQFTTHAGTLLGQKDLKLLRNMYAIFFFVVPAYMLRLKVRALTGVQDVDIGTIWAAFST